MSMKTMKTMKSYARIDANSQDVALIDVPVPEIEPNEVLVKIKAFGVGIQDRYFIPKNAKFPYTIGTEGAGIITEIGTQVTNFDKNDRVIFSSVLHPLGGTWAEYAVVNQDRLVYLPDNLTFVQGATIPIPGDAAIESMRSLNLSKGDKLFIAGASGAIGTFVIQMAVAKGIHVAGSASEKNHAYMESLGAEKTVDYHDFNWQEEIKKWAGKGVDAALAIQPETGIDSIEVVKDGGKLITVSGDSDQIPVERNITIQQMQHHDNTRQKMAELVNSIADGEIKIIIEKEYTFEQALDALKKTETRHARGKLVVKGVHV